MTQSEGTPGEVSGGREENEGSTHGVLHFLKLVLQSIVTGFLKNIPWMILIAVIVWILHMVLLGVADPAASPGSVSGLASILVTPGNELIGAIFWLLLAWIISTVIFQVRSGSFGRSVKKIGTVPAWLGESYHHSSILSLLVLSTGFLCALLIAAFIRNIVVSLQLVLVSLSWLAAQKEGIMVVFLGVVWGRVSGLFSREKNEPFEASYAGAGILGGVLGFLVSMVITLEGLESFLILGIIALIIIAIFFMRRAA